MLAGRMALRRALQLRPQLMRIGSAARSASPSIKPVPEHVMPSAFLQGQNICSLQPCLWLQKRFVTILRTVHANGDSQGNYNDIEIRVSDFNNSDKGAIVLAGDVFDVPIRPDIVHRVVRWQLAKRRQGTHSTKTISEVSGTGKKPYQQKGSGRARHGTLRGPQFRHGATMHGPKPRSHAHKLPKKVRRLGLKIALSARVAEGKLIVLDSVVPASHKTKEMVKYIAGLNDCRKVLFVDGADKVNTRLCRSTSNIYLADVLPAKGLNVYSILQHDTLVMTVDAVRFIENRMHTPISHRRAPKGKTLKREHPKRIVRQNHIWCLPSGASKPQKVVVTLDAQEDTSLEAQEKVTSEVTSQLAA